MNRRFIPFLAAIAVIVSFAHSAWAGRTFYVNAFGTTTGGITAGNDANSGLTAALPKKTIMGTAGVMAAGFGTQAGDTLYLTGTFRPLCEVTATGDVDQAWKINDGAGHNLNGLTIKQWPGAPQAMVRLDVPVAITSFNVTATPGVFDYDVPDGTCAWWTDTGDANKQKTLTEGIVDVVVDWDLSIDTNGRHFGHLRRSHTTTEASMADNSWCFIPNTPAAGSGGGGGTLRICLLDYADDDQLNASGLTIAFVPGNVCPLEVGTPTYQTYPTWGAYDGTKVVNFTLDGIHFAFGDPGYRKNKPLASGTGDDNTAYGVGLNVEGTVSTGYVRVADATGSTIQNCVFFDNGYHGPTWAGDHCTNNTYRNNVVWGLGPNTNAGSTGLVFYSGATGDEPNDIYGCRGYDDTVHLYTWLGRDRIPVTVPVIGSGDTGTMDADGYAPSADGFISHTNGGSATENVIRDIEMRRLKVVMYSDVFVTLDGNEAHHGQGFVGGNRCVAPGDNTNPWTYPIRFVDCELVNGIQNRTSLYDNSAYIRCRLALPRAGDYGAYTGGSGFYQGSTLGAASGASIVGYFGCEIVADIGSGSGETNFIAMNFDTVPNTVVAINTSFYNICAQSDTQSQAFVAFVNHPTSDTANRFYGRGNIFFHAYSNNAARSGTITATTAANPAELTTNASHGMATGDTVLISSHTGTANLNGQFTITVTAANKFTVPVLGVAGTASYLCTNSTDPGGPTRYLCRNARPGMGATAFNCKESMYGNITVDSYIAPYAGGTNNGSEANFTTNVDPNGVYLGIDPNGIQVGVGRAMRNPFAEPNGRSLRLTARAQAHVKYLTPAVDFGFNTSPLDGSHLKYSGNYGAWQYGPSESTYRRVLQRN